MVCVVGVRFKKAGKIYYFDPNGHEVGPGTGVIVETARGTEYGEVVVGPKSVPADDIVQPLKQVLRAATSEDRHQVEENQKKAKRAFDIGLAKIAAGRGARQPSGCFARLSLFPRGARVRRSQAMPVPTSRHRIAIV